MRELAMTQEAKIVFGLEDISKIRDLCCECRGEVTFPLKKGALQKDHGIPESHCPYCETPWSLGSRLAEFKLVSDIRSLASPKTEKSPPKVELRFEMELSRP